MASLPNPSLLPRQPGPGLRAAGARRGGVRDQDGPAREQDPTRQPQSISSAEGSPGTVAFPDDLSTDVALKGDATKASGLGPARRP